jgi:hypothetical protein
MFKQLKWARVVAYISGGGLSSVFALGGPHWTSIGMAIVGVAGAIGALMPATSIVQDSPVLAKNGTGIVGTNLSLPLPPKGP